MYEKQKKENELILQRVEKEWYVIVSHFNKYPEQLTGATSEVSKIL